MYWGTSTLHEVVHTLPGNKEIVIEYNIIGVRQDLIENNTEYGIPIGGMDGVGGFNAKDVALGQYIITAKIHDNSQIINCCLINNNKRKIIFPDITYFNDYTYISIIVDEYSPEDRPKWLINIISNIE